MPKLNPNIDFSKLESLHSKALDKYVQMLRLLYTSAIDNVVKVSIIAKLRGDNPFLFSDFPKIGAEVDKILAQLSGNITDLIDSGTLNQWVASNEKNDLLVDDVLRQFTLNKSDFSNYYGRNLPAYEQFQKQKINGRSLSERVWDLTKGQFKEELEMSIDIGLLDGRSAAQMARDIKQYLNEPKKLFRRVRDARGELHLSKHAKAYTPGQGQYRSSFKNAFRLTRSQINMSYRSADLERWQQIDFIIGFEVKLSGAHLVFDICDVLKGIYPKGFNFVGWHPACMCFMVPVMTSKEDFIKQIKGEKVDFKYVNNVPEGFDQWITDNSERISGWKNKPYFIRDNFKDGQISNGLHF